MAADLSTVAVATGEARWPMAGNREHFFPDAIVLSTPERISPTSPFRLAVWWLESAGRLQQLMVSYDERWASPAFSDSPSGPPLAHHTGSLSPFFVLDGAEVLQE